MSADVAIRRAGTKDAGRRPPKVTWERPDLWFTVG